MNISIILSHFHRFDIDRMSELIFPLYDSKIQNHKKNINENDTNINNRYMFSYLKRIKYLFTNLKIFLNLLFLHCSKNIIEIKKIKFKLKHKIPQTITKLKKILFKT